MAKGLVGTLGELHHCIGLQDPTRGPKIRPFPYVTFEEDLRNLSFANAISKPSTLLLPPLPWTTKLLTTDETAWEAALKVGLPRPRLSLLSKEYERLLSSLPYSDARPTKGTYFCKLPHNKNKKGPPPKGYKLLSWTLLHLMKYQLSEPGMRDTWRSAYQYLWEQKHFGKLCVKID